jgi:type IV pilus assembly protein PilA
MKSMQKGFTLIELMIVVAIIAILAAIAIPAYQDYVIRSQVSEGLSLADGSKTAIAEFYSNNGRFPTTNSSAGLAAASSINGNYVSTVTITSGLITVAYGGPKANKAIKTSPSTLVLSATTNGGSTQFTCKAGTNMPSKYLPSACR